MQAFDGGTGPGGGRPAFPTPRFGRPAEADTGPGAPSRTRLHLPREAGSAGNARQFVRERLSGRVSEPVIERMILAASELVTNAFKYGKGSIELRLHRSGDVIRLEVIDEGAAGPLKARESSASAIDGWGLRIVQALSLQWGVFEGTTHVWADFAAN